MFYYYFSELKHSNQDLYSIHLTDIFYVNLQIYNYFYIIWYYYYSIFVNLVAIVSIYITSHLNFIIKFLFYFFNNHSLYLCHFSCQIFKCFNLFTFLIFWFFIYSTFKINFYICFTKIIINLISLFIIIDYFINQSMNY